MEKFKHELILCIVNEGYSETVMESAKAVGAKGGTIIHARGTANKEAEKFFRITVQPEKEIVMILAKTELVDGILKGLYSSIGTATQAQGIAFALPVDEVAGLDQEKEVKEIKE